MSERPTTKHDIQRDELNTTRLNFSEVTRVFVSGSISMSYSGVDLGTGDVSLYAQDNIGIYGLSGTTGLGTGTSISFKNGLIASITGTMLYVENGQRESIAASNANDIFRCSNPGGVSAFVGTIATLPGGATLTYNVSSGQEGALVPASTSQLAKMRLYNTTRGTNALISNCVVGTNTITLTANVPVGWTVGDTITIASQTVVGSFSWVDLEITESTLLGIRILDFDLIINSATTGDFVLAHPFETFSASKYSAMVETLANATVGKFLRLKITSNLFSIAWSGTPVAVIMKLFGYT